MHSRLSYRIGFLTLLVSVVNGLSAQPDMMARADKFYANGVYPDAAEIYVSFLEQGYDYIVNTKLADCYFQMEDWQKAEYWYGVIASHNIADAGTLLRYADLLKFNGKYREAKTYYLKYAIYKPDGYYLASTCDWAISNKSKQGGYAIEPAAFNTAASEMTPAQFKRGVVFARSNGDEINPNTGTPYYDLYFAEPRVDNSWTVNAMEHVNSDFHEAAPFYDTNSKLLYFTRSNHINDRTIVSPDGQVKLELFYAAYTDGKFARPRPLTINSRGYSVGHPTLSPDGTILIFASDMAGGKGGIDLYYCLKVNNEWSEPKNMGEVINSPGDELYPYLAPDGVLYFSSNYHAGFGGQDIFKSHRMDDHWTIPENLGMPVNSSQDDYGFTIKNGFGYFTSNRPGGKGSDDIYQVTQLATISTLYVYDVDQKPVFKAKVTFVEGANTQIICETDVNGLGDVSTLSGASTSIKISKEGFLDKVINDIGSLRSSNGILPIELQPLLGTND